MILLNNSLIIRDRDFKINMYTPVLMQLFRSHTCNPNAFYICMVYVDAGALVSHKHIMCLDFAFIKFWQSQG